MRVESLAKVHTSFGGLHGVGAKCVNAVSVWFTAEVRREGKVHKWILAWNND